MRSQEKVKELEILENLLLLGFLGAVLALVFAGIQRSRVMSFSEGNDKMVKIASAIREGANAYLKHQYTTVGKGLCRRIHHPADHRFRQRRRNALPVYSLCLPDRRYLVYAGWSDQA